MNSAQAKTIQITEYLSNQGHFPKKERLGGNEQWYSSPIREGDSNPSFKVNTIENIWFDHGLSKGGSIIDLVMYQANVGISEALQILNETNLYTGLPSPIQKNMEFTQKHKIKIFASQKGACSEKKKNDISLKIEFIQEIKNSSLIEYLSERKIDLSIAKKHGLKEVFFANKKTSKTNYALGFPSGNGYEGRNSLGFKGFIGKGKTFTVINPDSEGTISIFEGFTDFLSFLTYYKLEDFKSTVVVLNSIVFAEKSLEIITQDKYSKIYLFLDNDKGGIETKQFYINKLIDYDIIDKSDTYKGYNDFNEMIMDKE